MIVVVASSEADLADARRRLAELGAPASEVLAPGGPRRLLLAAVADESDGTRLVARLRMEGRRAVMRPAGGPALEAWRRHTLPVRIGDRLALCFVWSEHDRTGLPEVVEIDPGGGFGSGAHPSTRLLLEELAARIAGGERVLDAGCGSGVLAISALRLGACRAVGIDLDPGAIEATRRNATLNGLERRVEATRAPLSGLEGTFDVVVANMGREALVDLHEELAARLSPGGWLAVSGFSSAQCALVAGWLRTLQVIDQRARGEWSALVLAKEQHWKSCPANRLPKGPRNGSQETSGSTL